MRRQGGPVSSVACPSDRDMNGLGANERPYSVRAAAPDDAAAIAAVHVGSWIETYSEILPGSMLRSLSVVDRAAFWARLLRERVDSLDPAVFVAESAGAIVGFASGGAQRDRDLRARGFAGEFTAIYVLRRGQRRGLGRQLMRAVASALLDRERRSASLWVLRDNCRAREFYARQGGEEIADREDCRGAVALREIAVGWRDLSVL